MNGKQAKTEAEMTKGETNDRRNRKNVKSHITFLSVYELLEYYIVTIK